MKKIIPLFIVFLMLMCLLIGVSSGGESSKPHEPNNVSDYWYLTTTEGNGKECLTDTEPMYDDCGCDVFTDGWVLLFGFIPLQANCP